MRCSDRRAPPLPLLGAATLMLALATTSAWAQDSARSGSLYDELARMDRELFDAAFVSCDQAKFASLFTGDAEFYHDRTGAAFGESVTQLRSCPRDNGVRRTLIEGSLEVYPIKDYGAIQMGRHTFTRDGEPGVERGVVLAQAAVGRSAARRRGCARSACAPSCRCARAACCGASDR